MKSEEGGFGHSFGNKYLNICQIFKNNYFCSPKNESFRLNKRNPTGIPPAGVNIKIEIMYAIVEIAGQQFRVEKDKKLYVQLLDAKEGDSVDFEKVLLFGNDDGITVGTPAVKGAKVTAKVLGQVKGDKVLVFQKEKKKRVPEIKWSPPEFTCRYKLKILLDN